MALSKPGERPSSEKSLEVIQIFPAHLEPAQSKALIFRPYAFDMHWHAVQPFGVPRRNAQKTEHRSQNSGLSGVPEEKAYSNRYKSRSEISQKASGKRKFVAQAMRHTRSSRPILQLLNSVSCFLSPDSFPIKEPPNFFCE